MLQPGRKYSSSTYRYGFNGKENDNEVKGEGNQQDYGMRIYDPRISKFLSVDPLTDEYSELTPYQFASNSPVAFIDRDGLEAAAKLPDGTIYIPRGGSDHLGFSYPKGAKLIDIPRDNKNGVKAISMALDNTPVVGSIKGAVEGSVGYDMEGNKLSGGDRFLGIIPYAKNFKKADNIIDVIHAADKLDEVKDATKAASKIDEAASAEKALVKNKNAKDAEGNFILYDVHEQPGKKGELLKIGKADADRTRASGDPVRMKDSERLAKKAGYPNATATVREKLGKTTTGQATNAEAAEVIKERAKGNTLPLNKEKSKKYKE